jgi:murein DD-endopeptidase MepM/ murein hydrolase activator NlpD
MTVCSGRAGSGRGNLRLFPVLCGILLVFSGIAGAEEGKPRQSARPRFALIPENPRPGEPVTLGFFSGGGLTGAALLNAQGRTLSRAAFFALPLENPEEPLMVAILTVPATAAPGPALVRVDGLPESINKIPLTIGERDFASEEIVLNQALTKLRAVPDPQKTAEAERLWAILSKTGTEIYGFGCFSPPVNSTRRTSFFGDRRVFKYAGGRQDTAIHAGIDYGVPTGTPVTVCGPGRIVLAGYRIVTGNSVVVEHLPGVYSLYYHLDSILVGEGLTVRAGTVLGTSGATGLATGPHLHWEIRVSGENTDPDAFISRPILDKDAILARMRDAVF